MPPAKKIWPILVLLTTLLLVPGLVFAQATCQSVQECATDFQTNGRFTLNGCGRASGGNIICQSGGLGTVGASTGGVWYDQTPEQFRNKVLGSPDNEIFGERYTYAQINWIFNTFVTMFSPRVNSLQDLTNFIGKLLSNQAPSLQDYASLGPLGLLMGGIGETLTNPPASGFQSVSQGLAKLQIVPSAYAQGVGYTSTSAVQKLWSASRNIAYLVSTILLIAAGFLIMFRVKINPQTVVSLQTMIPKLAITLILITFSYAIAGFVIDLIYVLISLFIGSLQFGVLDPAAISTAVGFFTQGSYNWVWVYFLVPLFLFFFLGALVGLGGFAALGPAGAIPGTIVAILAIIIFLLVIWILFKIWWMMVKTYITLIFLIIAGPWQIMLDLIPGQSGFGSWLRNIIANASVFVVVPIMFVLNMIFWQSPFALLKLPLISAIPALAPLGQLSAAFSGSFPNLPVIGGQGVIVQLAIGYAILALTPKVAEMIKDALKVPAFKYGSAIGEPLQFINKWGIQGAGTLAANAYETGRGPLPNTWTDAIGALRSVGVLGKRQ